MFPSYSMGVILNKSYDIKVNIIYVHLHILLMLTMTIERSITHV